MRIVRAIQVSMCAAVLCATFVTAARGDSWDKKTIVTFSDSVEIPGQVLPAGTYVFKLFNSASDRHIVQIWNEDETQILATMQAIPNYRFDTPDRTIFEFDERLGASPMALHSWFYPGDNFGREFVYPKVEHVEVSANPAPAPEPAPTPAVAPVRRQTGSASGGWAPRPAVERRAGGRGLWRLLRRRPGRAAGGGAGHAARH